MDPEAGAIRRIKPVTENGGAFEGVACARFITSRLELLRIRTTAKPPGRSRVRERAFGSHKCEHLYGVDEQIATVEDLHRECEAYGAVFNGIRPREALGFHRLPTEAGSRSGRPVASQGFPST